MTSPTSQTVSIRSKKLCVHVWSPTTNAHPGTVVVIFHGFRAHSLYPTVRYAAERLVKGGYKVVAPDLPGHGESPGLTGYLPSAEDLVEDCVAVAEYARNSVVVASKKEGGDGESDDPVKAKLFLLGSSMGGTIALSVARRMGEAGGGEGSSASSPLSSSSIAGVVLLAPMLRLSVGAASRYALRALSYVAPTWEVIPSSSTDAEKQYRDPAKREECDQHSEGGSGKIMVQSASTCVELANNIGDEFDSVSCPFLILVADEDVIVDNAGSRELFETAPSTDKTMKNFPALHGLLCEPSPLVEEIEGVMMDWINARSC